MALVNRDRVLETSTTTGTGTYTLAGAVTGFQDFSVVGNGNTCHYAAWEVDGSGNPSGGWETGLGTYTASGTTLARTTIYASSNAGAAVNWSAGTRRIACAPLTSGTLVVRQPGGTAGTDEVQMYHDGTDVININATSGGFHRIYDGSTSTRGTLVGNLWVGDNNAVRVFQTGMIVNGSVGSVFAFATDMSSAANATNSVAAGFVYVTEAVIKMRGGSGAPPGWLQQSAGRSRVNSAVTNTGITPAAITGLSHTLIAGRKYTGRMVLYAAVPTSADGIRIDFDGGTATMTSFVAQGILSDDTSTRKLSRTTALATDITDTDLNGDGLVVIELGFVCNAAGTFIPRIAKEADAAGATLTVLANSFLWLEDMP